MDRNILNMITRTGEKGKGLEKNEKNKTKQKPYFFPSYSSGLERQSKRSMKQCQSRVGAGPPVRPSLVQCILVKERAALS